MSWSFYLATISGIRVQVHFTFGFFIIWIIISGFARGMNAEAVLTNTLFVLALFTCVVLHEFGHALTAKRFGIRTRDITLLPIGGVARLERMPDDPRQEFLVALAGPAVNVVIAAALWMLIYAASGGTQPDFANNLNVAAMPLIQRILLINISLAIFNLLPAFPMDGGRILRAALAIRMPYAKATRIAASLGQGMAILFGIVGYFVNPMLMLIALFVWIGAAEEAGMAQLRAALAGVPVREAMLTSFEAVSPHDTLDTVAHMILNGDQRDFPVIDEDRIVGVVTRDTLLRALAAPGEPPRVGDIMDREVALADAGDPLETTIPRLNACPSHTLPVLENRRLVGLLTAENLGEFLMIRTALGSHWIAGTRG